MSRQANATPGNLSFFHQVDSLMIDQHCSVRLLPVPERVIINYLQLEKVRLKQRARNNKTMIASKRLNI